MILPYLARLVCMSLACFFLVHFALGLGVSWLAPSILAWARRLRPSSAARLLWMARLAPLAGAGLVLAGICVPSYLWLEPDAQLEEVGLACLAAALLSVAIVGLAMNRGLRAMARSIRYRRDCQRVGCETRLAGETTPVVVIDGGAGLLALAGILHPRLMISRDVLRELSDGELEAALRHERAHRTSRDNLKHWLLLLAPEILPFRLRVGFLSGFESLERGWARAIEWAADDTAVRGDSRGSIWLAGALVRVARLGGNAPVTPLMTSLVADGRDLEARVDRLLEAALDREQPAPGGAAFLLAIPLLAGILAAAWMGPSTLQAAHGLLERLVR